MTTHATTSTPYRTNAVRRPRARSSALGVRLVVVCAALLVSSGAALGVICAVPKVTTHCPGPSSKNDLRAVHAGAEAWRANHAGACPTVDRLRAEKELAVSTNVNDAWGHPYEIRCEGETTTVMSRWLP